MKIVFPLSATFFLCCCQSISPEIGFNEAISRAKSQPADISYAYEEVWDTFNNENKLDEKDGCYKKSNGMIQQVLVIDKSGLVTDVVADIKNKKSNCFRNSYMNVRFPAPPFSPYYMYLRMH